LAIYINRGVVSKCDHSIIIRKLDVPDANPEAIKLAQRYGMKPVSEVARMYNKEIPNLPINRVFAVTSLEVG
jgi:Acetyltransferase (GNAT) domain